MGTTRSRAAAITRRQALFAKVHALSVAHDLPYLVLSQDDRVALSYHLPQGKCDVRLQWAWEAVSAEGIGEAIRTVLQARVQAADTVPVQESKP